MKIGKLFIFSILIALFLLAGCSNQEEEEVSFTAIVLEINQSSLLVEPAEGSVELSSADRIVAHVGDAMITDSQGNASDCYKDECALWVDDTEVSGSEDTGACAIIVV